MNKAYVRAGPASSALQSGFATGPVGTRAPASLRSAILRDISSAARSAPFSGRVPGSPPLPCFDAADADDDGVVNGLIDGLYILNYQFLPGFPPPPAPGPDECGADPTPDMAGCNRYDACP